MYLGDILMEMFPNIHFVGMLTVVYTLVYRKKALIPLYIYVFLNGLFAGFNLWWMPYLSIWTILWGISMLIPRKLHPIWLWVISSVICALHGFAFGALYSPAQAIMFGLNFKQTIAWIIAGIPFDIIHGIGNFVASAIVILPLVTLLCRLERIKMPFVLKKDK